MLSIAIGDLLWSSIFILFGGILDLFDGLAARFLNASSNFGKELDSLADVITFGAAPAYLYYLIKPGDEWFYYVPMLIIASGAAVRLAKFNIEKGDYRFFIGMASPSTAFMIVGVIAAIYLNSKWVIDGFNSILIYFLFSCLIFSLNLIPLKMFSVKSIKSYPITIYLFGVLLLFLGLGLFFFQAVVILFTFFLYIILSFIFHFRIS